MIHTFDTWKESDSSLHPYEGKGPFVRTTPAPCTCHCIYTWHKRTHLSVKSHSEVRPEQPAAGLDHLHDLIVGSVQSVVQSAQFLQKQDKLVTPHRLMQNLVSRLVMSQRTDDKLFRPTGKKGAWQWEWPITRNSLLLQNHAALLFHKVFMLTP